MCWFLDGWSDEYAALQFIMPSRKLPNEGKFFKDFRFIDIQRFISNWYADLKKYKQVYFSSLLFPESTIKGAIGGNECTASKQKQNTIKFIGKVS